MAQISQTAIELIVAAEVTSRAIYEKKYRHPEWPGGASGITIAIGYDVGYASPAKFRKDWYGRISQGMIEALLPCCGVRGEAARRMLASVRDKVDVPWQPAMDIFMLTDLPEWIAKVCRAVLGAEKLNPDCLGALV